MENPFHELSDRLSSIESLLTQLVNQKSNETQANNTGANFHKKYVYGLQGLAQFLNCSHPTAQRVKKKLPKTTYIQVGRKITFDVDAVMNALNKRG